MSDRAQAATIAAILAAKPAVGVRAWLDRLAAALAAETRLAAATVADLTDRGRPRWGTRTAEDAAAYVDFWAELTTRHAVPMLRGGYADVLLLLGDRGRAREALDIYLAAARRDPEVFIPFAADFADVATAVGARMEYELVMLRFYVSQVALGEMDEDDLREAMQQVLADHAGAPGLVEEVRAITSAVLGPSR